MESVLLGRSWRLWKTTQNLPNVKGKKKEKKFEIK